MKKVVKFGGSSLASAEQFEKVGSIIRADKGRRFVVPSAPGKRFPKDTKVTDMLYDCYHTAQEGEDFTEKLAAIAARYQEIIDGLHLDLDLSADFLQIGEDFKKGAGTDYAASRGEYLNGKIMAEYLGYEFIDPAGLVLFDENKTFMADETDKLLSSRLKDVQQAVIPGFYGSHEDGRICTFSRGGSDVTGSIVAKAITADLYENWTDVSGFMLADPRIIKDPEIISTVTYRELRELSYMGAGVLHEDAIFPLRRKGIPINVRNTNKPDDPGTMIVQDTVVKNKYKITGIAGKKDFVTVNITKDMMNAEIGFGRRALQAFEDNGISFEHMPSGIDTLTVLVHQSEFVEKEQKILAEINRLCQPDDIELEADLALIAVVGREMKSTVGVVGRIFSALAHARVNVKMIDQGSSELNIIIGVSNKQFETAIRAIYDIFVTAQV